MSDSRTRRFDIPLVSRTGAPGVVRGALTFRELDYAISRGTSVMIGVACPVKTHLDLLQLSLLEDLLDHVVQHVRLELVVHS